MSLTPITRVAIFQHFTFLPEGGIAVTFITNDAAALKTQIATLAGLDNVRLGACSVATEIFHVENALILPEIFVVGNTFISALGFQAVGYAPILTQ